ncbi:MAG: hypothetical protein K6F92_03770 [Lachnospiraceae bacterium]|nr:hypothetical protein [Lachnospiraceae bacterium]
MLKFEEELENFKPLPEIEQTEKIINDEPLADVTDILKSIVEMSAGDKKNS